MDTATVSGDTIREERCTAIFTHRRRAVFWGVGACVAIAVALAVTLSTKKPHQNNPGESSGTTPVEVKSMQADSRAPPQPPTWTPSVIALSGNDSTVPFEGESTAAAVNVSAGSQREGDKEDAIGSDDNDDWSPPTASTLLAILAESVGGPDPLYAAIASGRPITEGTDDMCVASGARELRVAVEQGTCPTVLLTNASSKAYLLEDEIVVNRTVTVMGHPAIMSTIDGHFADRSFHVKDGGFLELKYVRLVQGGGVIRDRYFGLTPVIDALWPHFDEDATIAAEDAAAQDDGGRNGRDLIIGGKNNGPSQQPMAATTSEKKTQEQDGSYVEKEGLKGRDLEDDAAGGHEGGPGEEFDVPQRGQVIEIRGGGCMVASTGQGATFVGVVFVAVAVDEEAIQATILLSQRGVGGRIYGGHIFSAGGTIRFFDCIFWDIVTLVALTDQIVMGGDVLVLAGEAYFTNCRWLGVQLFGTIFTAGASITVLGGNCYFTFVHLVIVGIYAGSFGPGSTLLVGAGTMVITGMIFQSFTGISNTAGIGNFCTGAGMMIITGLAVHNAIGAESAMGAGFFHAVGSGVLVQTGVAIQQYTGPTHQELIGANMFLGSGVAINTGVAQSLISALINHNGQAGLIYNGAGLMTYIASPTFVVAGTIAFQGLGGLLSQPAGLLVVIGSPILTIEGLAYFAGLGRDGFVGAGAAVIGGSPVYGFVGLEFPDEETPSAATWWIAGNTETPGPTLNFSFVTSGTEFEGSDAVEVGSEEGMQRTTLLARNLKGSRYIDFKKDKKQVAELKKFVPPDILRAVRRLQSKMRKLRHKTRRTAPTFWLASNESLTCSYCNVGKVGGPGAAVCDGMDTCDADQDAHDNHGAEETKYNAHHLVMTHLMVTSGPEAKLPALAVREALKAYVRAHDYRDVHVSAYPSQPEASSLQKFTAPPARSLLETSEYPKTHNFKAVFVTTETETAKKVADAFTMESESHRKTVAWLLEHLQEREGVELGSVEAMISKRLTIPAYNSEALTKAAFGGDGGRMSGSNTVSVVRKGAEARPVDDVVVGEVYVVRLENFPPRTGFSVQLIGSKQVALPGASRIQSRSDGLHFQTVSVVRLMVSTDDEGDASFEWEPTDSIEPQPSYYLKAVDATGLKFGMSSTLSVSPRGQAVKRRLYGPIMHI